MADKTIIQKLGDNLVLIIPKELCNKLDIKEGMIVDMETFTCCGSLGIRIKLTDTSGNGKDIL